MLPARRLQTNRLYISMFDADPGVHCSLGLRDQRSQLHFKLAFTARLAHRDLQTAHFIAPRRERRWEPQPPHAPRMCAYAR